MINIERTDRLGKFDAFLAVHERLHFEHFTVLHRVSLIRQRIEQMITQRQTAGIGAAHDPRGVNFVHFIEPIGGGAHQNVVDARTRAQAENDCNARLFCLFIELEHFERHLKFVVDVDEIGARCNGGPGDGVLILVVRPGAIDGHVEAAHQFRQWCGIAQVKASHGNFCFFIGQAGGDPPGFFDVSGCDLNFVEFAVLVQIFNGGLAHFPRSKYKRFHF